MPAFGWQESGSGTCSASARRGSTISRGPVEQFRPMMSAPHAAIITASESGSGPSTLRPGGSSVICAIVLITICVTGPDADKDILLYDVAPDLEVRTVYPGEDVGTRQQKDLVAPLPTFEVLDRQVAGKLHPLQGRAHGAVENDDPAGNCI